MNKNINDKTAYQLAPEVLISVIGAQVRPTSPAGIETIPTSLRSGASSEITEKMYSFKGTSTAMVV